MLKKVLFERSTSTFDRYDLRPDAREVLQGHAAWLKANPQSRVAVEGHCDERGTSEYNLALGAKRAEREALSHRSGDLAEYAFDH